MTGSSAEHSPQTVSAGGAKSWAQMSGSGLAAPDIDHMQLDFADGTKIPVSIKSLGGYRFFAYIVPAGKEVTGVTAFDSTGNALPVQKDTR